ncbi:hypothetical protein FOH24_07530 [Acetobacter tropicalis]|uniref:DUF1579 domain-containing protein n=1 Tax=Acetobacter tropicalis TaxID=104102 RepID=A0A094YWI1_9PROT|nr:hypothetical protein [Acetobacter tropicalis]KAA8384260.1 hypothetical protein FOH22_15020 [Acetobacter tropicalis]KAA8391363.1 hypothetical protein FOH24_07530 [Acetobacter tropicalis]KGB26340.1 hypothetical protein AtDm6_0210 [Acetobacter tropicalis]MBC9010275.1 hypothetical protein [Acetobacter tropicalis]MDO8172426.1 hypothetical protein [Acetobacter tropicalis]
MADMKKVYSAIGFLPRYFWIYAFLLTVSSMEFVSPAVQAAEEPWHGTDARQQLPDALLGPWKEDIAASHYTDPPPRKALRFFSYTEGGKVLVSFMTLSAKGQFSSGHWTAAVDGTPGTEYHSQGGSIPFNVVYFTKIDDYNYHLLVKRNGKLEITADYSLSSDGRTLSYRYGNNVIVYHRWDMMEE